MKEIVIVVIVLFLLFALFGWSLCRMGAIADENIEAARREKEKENER